MDLTTYQTLLDASVNGSVLVPGSPGSSLILGKTAGAGSDFAQFIRAEQEIIEAWIAAGAVE